MRCSASGVRVEDARQHHLAVGVEQLLGSAGQVLSERHDASFGDADIGFELTDPRDDQGPAANEKIEVGSRLHRKP
jgi:hypothetical protein